MPIKSVWLEPQQTAKILCHNLTFEIITESLNNFFEFHGRAADRNRPLLRHVLPTNNTARGCSVGGGMTVSLFAAPLPIAALCCIANLDRRGWHIIRAIFITLITASVGWNNTVQP